MNTRGWWRKQALFRSGQRGTWSMWHVADADGKTICGARHIPESAAGQVDQHRAIEIYPDSGKVCNQCRKAWEREVQVGAITPEKVA